MIKIGLGQVWMPEQIQTAGGAAASPRSTQRGTKVPSSASSAQAKYSAPDHQETSASRAPCLL